MAMHAPLVILSVAAGLASAGSAAKGAAPEDFGAAATACFEATQSRTVNEALIESLGWTRQEGNLSFLPGATSSFRRQGSNVSIIVADQERQCLAIWVAPSERDDGPAAGVATRSIRTAIDERYGDEATATSPVVEGSRTSVHYQVQGSVGVLRTDNRGLLVQHYFVAMNKDVAAPASTEANLQD